MHAGFLHSPELQTAVELLLESVMVSCAQVSDATSWLSC